MHPAISVIFFTVTSGAGFGFIALIGLGVPLPQGGIGAFVAALTAGLLAAAGLVSSTFHLGHPERAWRAFSQWRSSWLSREGVCAIITLALFGIYALLWVFFEDRNLPLGIAMAIGAIATVYTTAMIYAQLKTVPSWNQFWTPICYLLFALSAGLLLSSAFGYWQGGVILKAPLLSGLVIAIAWGAKLKWWARSGEDTLAARGSTTGSATGLGKLGEVRLLEKPHSGENYLTKEMVHKIGRKHGNKLRKISLVLGAAIPMLVCLLVFMFGLPSLLMFFAFMSLMAGLFVERWLFFAEAKHAVSLYY